FNSNTNQYDQTPIIQEVPISQSQNINFNNMYQKSLNRSSSSPSMATIDKVNHNFYQQNQNYTQLMYQQNQNPNNQAFLQNQINNVNLRYQYQQNDKKDINNNFNFNQTQQYQSKNKILNISQNTRLNNQTLPQNNTLQRHNSSQAPFDSQSNMQKLQEQQIVQQKQPTQQKLKAQDQKKVDSQKKLQLSQLQKQKMNQIPSQHSSRHGQKKNSKLSQQSSQSHILQKKSQPIEKSRNQQKLEVQPKLKSNYSQKIIRQKPSLKNEITEQQIALAQMASLQNQKNPSNYNVSAVSLDHRFLDREGNEETQSQYEREDQESEQQERVSEQDIKKIEADVFENLYRTETGLIIFRNGLLRGIIHKFAEITDVVSKIQIMLTAGVKFNIIYRASEHGDKAKTFHQKCDNHQMTLVLVETTKGRRFGGFTTKTWDGNCVKKIDNDAFVFSLDKHKIYDVHKNEFAIGGYPKFGPVFFGCQIRIYDEFFKKGGTTCHRTLNYKTKEDYELNSGEQTYIVKEIEVYDIEVIKIT
ncbi:MAG: TLD domain-containing protein, partial [Clostridia bacterium]|nr:TLD domain-containing protein [Clostridia bacterium]